VIETVARLLATRLRLPAENLSFLKVPGRHSLTLLLFRPGEANPCYVAKRPCGPQHTPHLLAEAEGLKQAWRFVEATDLAPTIPEILVCEDGVTGWLLLETALPGKSMVNLLRAPLRREINRSRRVLQCAFDWLARFHVRAMAYVPQDGGRLGEYLVAASGGATSEQPFREAEELVQASAARLEELTGGNCALSLCHGDYHPFNLLANSEGVGVCDWGESHVGVPLLDPCRLFTALITEVPYPDDTRIVPRFHAHFFDPREAPARRAMADYLFGCAGRLGFGVEAVNAFYPVQLLRTANNRPGDRRWVEAWAEVVFLFRDRLRGRLSEA